MLLGHTDGLSQYQPPKDRLLSDLVSELDIDETAECSEQVLYEASFEEFGRYSVQYDTIIWLAISLLLVLAWGFGIILLLYLPYKRYVLQKDFSTRKLFVTPRNIVYKVHFSVSRPSYIPFWGTTKIEKHIPLSLVIDIIIEQGCLQAVYGIHTFRVESIVHGKAAPVDELQVQGISNPDLLRKIIIREASRVIQESWNTSLTAEVESMLPSNSMEGPTILNSPSRRLKTSRSPHYVSRERASVLSQELLLQKLEEVNKSVMKIEQLFNKPSPTQEIS